ncbi:GNAT family N-acetyltransferase [Streptomyces sp. NPDC003393]
MIVACEREVHGRAETEPDRVAADLAVPGLVPELDTLLVHDRRSGELIGRAWVRGRRTAIDVHPDHRDRGLGSSLVAWAEARAVQAGTERLSQTVSDNDRPAVVLLRSRGYETLVSEWLLEFAMPDEPAVPEPPSDITVRPFRSGDEQAAYQLVEDAFDEWQQRRESYEEWALRTVRRATFVPEASPVAFADGQMVGVVLALDPGTGEGYVERVAVRRDHRHRGIARLLLRDSFRTFHRRRKQACVLWTHSDTGALSLYERLGLTVRRSFTVYSRTLTSGEPSRAADRPEG